MRCLVACEESQAVTIELRRLGVEAYSCDVLPCSGGHPEWHLLQDVTPLLADRWDMVIAFPPCTHLCVSGASWWAKKRESGEQQAAIDFFLKCYNANSDFVAVENPPGIMGTMFRQCDQMVKANQFGEQCSKRLCLWLRGLPFLKQTNLVDAGHRTRHNHSQWYADSWKINDPQQRSIVRSKTFPGVASAMAQQWSRFVAEKLRLSTLADSTCITS